ncbi:MAG: ribonuclease HII [Syntrophobacteraceae bacterium]
MESKTTKTPHDIRFFEEQAYRRGFQFPAGIDEVGRGPLAGPVVAAAVILPSDCELPLVRDSKLLSPSQRETCARDITSCAGAVGVGLVAAFEIDRINILQATFRAMVIAVESLAIVPDFLLIDGPYKLPIPVAQEGIRQGDRLSLSIAAASIIAKVHRDRLMCEYHQQFPVYGFDKHKGYGTRQHLEALRRYGPCPLHRLSFRGAASGNGENLKDDCEPA